MWTNIGERAVTVALQRVVLVKWTDVEHDQALPVVLGD